MKRCAVCGEIVADDVEVCPVCKATKFVPIEENTGFACEHHVGDGKVEDKEVMDGLRANFEGECTEVGMYLAMARVAEREGYPEIAEAYKRYAFEEAEHASKLQRRTSAMPSRKQSTQASSQSFWAKSSPIRPRRISSSASLPKRARAQASSRSQSARRSSATTPSTTPCTRWQRTKRATAQASRAFSRDTSASNFIRINQKERAVPPVLFSRKSFC